MQVWAAFPNLMSPTYYLFQGTPSLLISWILLIWTFSYHNNMNSNTLYLCGAFNFSKWFYIHDLVFLSIVHFPCELGRANMISFICQRQVDHRSFKWFFHHRTARATSLPLCTPSNPFLLLSHCSLFSASYQYTLYREGFQFQVPLLESKLSCHNGTLCWDYNRLSVLSSSADGDLWMGMERRIMIIFTITIARRRCVKCLTRSSSFLPGISCQGKVAPSHSALEWSDKYVRKLVPGAVFCFVNSFHWYIIVAAFS